MGKPRKPLSPPGLVYRHKKGTWESREKKRKEKDQGRQEGGSSKGNVPCVLNQEFLFLAHEYWGSEATRLGWSIGSYETWSTRKPCAKAVPKTDSLTQWKQYHKRPTLRATKLPLWSIHSEECPDYCLSQVQESCHLTSAKCHIIYGMGMLKILLQSIRSEEDRTIALERSARKLSEDKQQSTLFTSLDIPWWFHTWAVLRSLANARKCQLEDFCEKERYESCSVQGKFTADTFRNRQKKENSTVVMLLPGSHERLASRNPRVLSQKHGGACTIY